MGIKGLNKLKDIHFVNQGICFVLACCVVYFINYYVVRLEIERDALANHPKIYKATLFERLLGAPRYYKNTIRVYVGPYTLEEVRFDPSRLEDIRSGKMVMMKPLQSYNTVYLWDDVDAEVLDLIETIVNSNWNLYPCKGSKMRNCYLALRAKQFCIWWLAEQKLYEAFDIGSFELFYFDRSMFCISTTMDGFADESLGCDAYSRKAGYSYFVSVDGFVYDFKQYLYETFHIDFDEEISYNLTTVYLKFLRLWLRCNMFWIKPVVGSG